MATRIDVDRGVLMRYLDGTGIQVYMYFDQPGVFLNAFGSPISDELARQAGFDVDALTKERVKRERMAKAFADIEAEIEGKNAEEGNVLLERDGHQLIDIGLGRVVIKDPDGGNLTSLPVPEEMGRKLFDGLVPDRTVSEVEVKSKGKKNGSKET